MIFLNPGLIHIYNKINMVDEEEETRLDISSYTSTKLCHVLRQVDKKLQQKLLTEEQLLKHYNQSDGISAWLSDNPFGKSDKYNDRKSTNKPSIQRRISSARKSHINDFRKETLPKTEDFKFKHFTDSKKYIEQYRKFHTCGGPLEKLSSRETLASLGKEKTIYFSSTDRKISKQLPNQLHQQEEDYSHCHRCIKHDIQYRKQQQKYETLSTPKNEILQYSKSTSTSFEPICTSPPVINNINIINSAPPLANGQHKNNYIYREEHYKKDSYGITNSQAVAIATSSTPPSTSWSCSSSPRQSSFFGKAIKPTLQNGFSFDRNLGFMHTRTSFRIDRKMVQKGFHWSHNME